MALLDNQEDIIITDVVHISLQITEKEPVVRSLHLPFVLVINFLENSFISPYGPCTATFVWHYTFKWFPITVLTSFLSRTLTDWKRGFTEVNFLYQLRYMLTNFFSVESFLYRWHLKKATNTVQILLNHFKFRKCR